jgi:hypothetical protein
MTFYSIFLKDFMLNADSKVGPCKFMSKGFFPDKGKSEPLIFEDRKWVREVEIVRCGYWWGEEVVRVVNFSGS